MIHVIITTYNNPKNVKKCLNKISEVSREINILVCDNNSKEETKKVLKTFENKFNIHYNDKNIGKSALVNKMYKSLKVDRNDILIIMDGDLEIVGSSDDFFNLSEKIIKGLDCSIAVANQQGNNCHKFNAPWIYCEPGKFNYVANLGGGGMAGGVTIIKCGLWEEVGGYRENTGPNETAPIYGSDDGFLLHDSSLISEKPVVIIKELLVNHPFDEDPGYKKWKNDRFVEHLRHGFCLETKGYYD
jgi:glycosyltransferase involved in cell wall biosynthesis